MSIQLPDASAVDLRLWRGLRRWQVRFVAFEVELHGGAVRVFKEQLPVAGRCGKTLQRIAQPQSFERGAGLRQTLCAECHVVEYAFALYREFWDFDQMQGGLRAEVQPPTGGQHLWARTDHEAKTLVEGLRRCKLVREDSKMVDVESWHYPLS